MATLYERVAERRRSAIKRMEKAQKQFRKGLIPERERDQVFELFGAIADECYERMGRMSRR